MGFAKSSELSSSQRVRLYLDKEFVRADLPQGTRLPAVRALARQLNVSTATIYHVYKELMREGKILSDSGRGTYLAGNKKVGATERLSFAMGTDTSYGCGSAWTGEIVNSLFRSAARADQRIALIPFPSQLEDTKIIPTLMQERESVNGLILFPRPLLTTEALTPMLDAYREAQRPVVFINPFSLQSTSNFVSSDFFEASYRLAFAWGSSGRRHIVFLSIDSLHTSVSDMLRLAGLQSGLSASGLWPQESLQIVSISPSSTTSREAAFEATGKLLQKEKVDAIYCSSDFLAMGVLDAAHESGRDIPGDISIVGGTGLTSLPDIEPLLTRLQQPFAEVGDRVINMLLRLQPAPSQPQAGEYIRAPYFIGTTTRPEENALLGVN